MHIQTTKKYFLCRMNSLLTFQNNVNGYRWSWKYNSLRKNKNGHSYFYGMSNKEWSNNNE